MLTKSAKKIISGLPGGAQIQPPGSNNTYVLPVTDIKGNTRYIVPGSPYAAAGNSLIKTEMKSVPGTGGGSNRVTSYGFAIGSDGTPPTEDNYKLGNQITGFAASEAVIDKEMVEDKKYILEYDWLVKNTTGEDIVVREMGMFHCYLSGANRGDTKQTTSTAQFANEACVMIDREVFDKPLTIKAGSSGVVRYRFVYDWT